MTLRATAHAARLALVALTAGCGNDFAERSEITNLRFLAIQAEPPWLVFGEEASLHPLVVAQAEGSSLRYEWSWCPLRGPNSEAFRCLIGPDELAAQLPPSLVEFLPPATNDEPDLQEFDIGTSSTARLENIFPPEVFEGTTDDQGNAIPGLCDLFQSNQLGELSRLVDLPDCDGTFPVSVKVVVTDGERTIRGFKTVRLVYDGRADLNANPDISELGILAKNARGEVFTSTLAYDTGVLLELTNDPEQPADDPARLAQIDRLSEVYTATRTEVNDDNEEREVQFIARERLTLSWYTYEGFFDFDRTGYLPSAFTDDDGTITDPQAQIDAWRDGRTNAWQTPKPGDFPPGTTRIFVVIRDDREGMSWTFQDFPVGEASR